MLGSQIGNVSFLLGTQIGDLGLLATSTKEERTMYTILLIVLVLLLIGALPTWPYSTGWGYYPSGGLGFVLIIVLVLVLMGRG
jgi:Protein of unknown function (DUF3309)